MNNENNTRKTVLDQILEDNGATPTIDLLAQAITRVRAIERNEEKRDEDVGEAQVNFAKYQEEMQKLIDPDTVKNADSLKRMTEVAVEIKKASTQLANAQAKAANGIGERIGLINVIKKLASELDDGMAELMSEAAANSEAAKGEAA